MGFYIKLYMTSNTSKEMVSTKNKNKVLLCSTPENRGGSPSRDSDSEAASPVPFLCTQDGAEGETDVIWNFYTPKSENTPTSRVKNSTPLSRRSKRSIRPKTIEKQIPKRRAVKPSQIKSELFQELFELNQNLHELMARKQQSCVSDKPQSGSEDDIFSESLDCSPKCIPKNSSRCLRKNVLSSKVSRPDTETALESDDSMNECLLKASQIVEERMLKTDAVPAKRTKYENRRPTFKTDIHLKMDQDSMDAILSNIRLESPVVSKVKKCDSPSLYNDSFDSFVGNLNDSALEQLTQMPIKADLSKTKSSVKRIDWTVKELVNSDGSPSSKSFFGRHSSMPESPSVLDMNKPSTSGMAFGRYNSMPYNEADTSTVLGDSPIRCTPDEIKKKHQLAREKLMAKRLLPFTSQQTQSLPTQISQQTVKKKTQFQPKIASSTITENINNNYVHNVNESKQSTSNSVDLKQLIEKKRQEALMKLRRRQPQNK